MIGGNEARVDPVVDEERLRDAGEEALQLQRHRREPPVESHHQDPPRLALGLFDLPELPLVEAGADMRLQHERSHAAATQDFRQREHACVRIEAPERPQVGADDLLDDLRLALGIIHGNRTGSTRASSTAPEPDSPKDDPHG